MTPQHLPSRANRGPHRGYLHLYRCPKQRLRLALPAFRDQYTLTSADDSLSLVLHLMIVPSAESYPAVSSTGTTDGCTGRDAGAFRVCVCVSFRTLD